MLHHHCQRCRRHNFHSELQRTQTPSLVLSDCSACLCKADTDDASMQGVLEKLAQQQLMAQIDLGPYVGMPILLLLSLTVVGSASR